LIVKVSKVALLYYVTKRLNPFTTNCICCSIEQSLHIRWLFICFQCIASSCGLSTHVSVFIKRI